MIETRSEEDIANIKSKIKGLGIVTPEEVLHILNYTLGMSCAALEQYFTAMASATLETTSSITLFTEISSNKAEVSETKDKSWYRKFEKKKR